MNAATMAPEDAHMFEMMTRLGWRWTDQHLILCVQFNGQWYRVAFPIQRVDACVAGCLPPSVGADWGDCPPTVGGWWKKLTRKVKRAVKKAVPKAIRRASQKLYRKAAKLVRRLVPIGKSIVRSKILTGVLAAASFVPGAAAITAPALAAQQVAIQAIKMAERGYEAAKAIERGVRDPKTFAQKRAGLAALHTMKVIAAKAKKGDRHALEKAAAMQQLLGKA
jgi:hypothetical protein